MNNKPQEVIYLASPYTDIEAETMTLRARQASVVAGELKKNGLMVYSPITHGHAIAQVVSGLPVNYESWQKFSVEMLKRCDHLYVLRLDGGEISVGVHDEIQVATQ